MKHRAKSSKIKYQHRMIQGLRSYLEKELEPLAYVKSIFPAEIKHTKKHLPGLRIRFQYETKTGAKLLAFASGAVQEVFIVTNNVEALKKKL